VARTRPGVLKVPFGVGLGGGDTFKCLVEDTDDPALLEERL
jgi:hypothetical protein